MTNNLKGSSFFQSDNSYEKVYYAKPITKKDTKPYFQVKSKNDTGEYVEAGNVVSIRGNLISVEPSTYEWEGKTIKQVKLQLVNNESNELVIISSSWTSTLKGIMNSILGHQGDCYNDLQIVLYRNRAGYNAVYCRVGKDKLNWKYSAEQLKQYTTITKYKGEDLVDDSKLIDLFEKEIIETLMPKLRKTDDVVESDVNITEEDIDDFFEFDK